MVTWGWFPLVAELLAVFKLSRILEELQLLPFNDLVSGKWWYLPFLWSDFVDPGWVGLLLLCWIQWYNFQAWSWTLSLGDLNAQMNPLVAVVAKSPTCTSKLANSTASFPIDLIPLVIPFLVVFFSSVVWVSLVEDPFYRRYDRRYRCGISVWSSIFEADNLI